MTEKDMFDNEEQEQAGLPEHPPEVSLNAIAPRANITVNNLAALRDAITNAPSTPYEIEVGTNFPITASAIIVPTGKQITLSGATLTRGAGYLGYLFDIQGGTFTLGSIVIDGIKSSVAAERAMIHVDTNATLNITDGAVLRNNLNTSSTLYTGGAVRADGHVNMTGGLITGNNALNADGEGWGGGIYSSTTGSINMSGGEISGNEANDGGGIGSHSTETPAMIMSGGLISSNVATHPVGLGSGGGGGGIAIQYGDLILRNDARIENNTAVDGGGIVASSNNTVTMEGGYVVGNHAVNSGTFTALGGGLVVETLIQTGGYITGNDSEGYGGGVVDFVAYHIADGAVLSNNSAVNGGGVYNVGAFTAQNAIMTGNVATTNGGAMYLINGSADFIDTQLAFNTAGMGGAIYNVASRPLSLSGSNMLVADNTATEDNCNTGGAIWTGQYSVADIGPGVIFTRNYAAYAYNMPLGADQADYDAHVHSPSLDPQYDYAYNNADINFCPSEDPSMQITYWRNAYPSDPTKMIFGSNLAEGAEIEYGPPMWEDGEYFAGWSLRPDDSCPNLTDPAPTVYHRSEFSADTPPNLNVYAIWCATPVYHEVTFDANGGSAVPGQSVLDGDQAVFGLSSRAGCVLEGWYTHPSLDVRFNFATPIHENLHLYAKWICDGQGAGHLTPAEVAELAKLEGLLAALEQGEKCYNIGILTEYKYQIIERDGQHYLNNQLIKQDYLAIIPLTIAEVENDIEKLEGGE
jgi:hypothetical protein